ncbi:MAG: peptide deformylase [Candidatus Methylacidiphilales bacterium]
MILEIVLYGHPVLRKKGLLVETITPELLKLAEDMIDTMHNAQGVGLAAQQVGHALQLAVVDIPPDTEAPSRMWMGGLPVDWREYMPMVLINPEVKTIKSRSVAEEGCLSFPGITAEISRSSRIHCCCLNEEGKKVEFEADGLLGRAVQHELDHLKGVLFTDHMLAEEKRAWRADIETIRLKGQEQARGITR